MKASELREKNPAELQQELNDLLKAQFSLRMQVATQQLTNTSQIRKVRRDIARVRTIISEKAGINTLPIINRKVWNWSRIPGISAPTTDTTPMINAGFQNGTVGRTLINESVAL